MALRRVASDARHPFEVYVLLATILGIVHFNSGGSFYQVAYWASPLFLGFYAWVVLAGSALSLTGAFLNNRIVGLLIEQVGMVALAGAAFTFGTIGLVGFNHNPNILFASLLVIGFGFSAFMRWYFIQRAFTVARRMVLNSGSR